jgi:adenine phosphoribosyltransferase
MGSKSLQEKSNPMDELKKMIREVPDWPKPGILFYDLTTLVQNPRGLSRVVDNLAERYRSEKIDVVAGIEARGFILAPAVALRLGTGFVPIRKPNKLPWKTSRVTYQLEYGTDTLEIHQDAVRPGQRVLLIDDLLATGGTAAAAVTLLRQLGGEVTGTAFIVELTFLNGRTKLPGLDVHSLLQYSS